ncbi:hypothetical protein C0389_01695 [bacterium]|nr:hypothetical protein [bacterium]
MLSFGKEINSHKFSVGPFQVTDNNFRLLIEIAPGAFFHINTCGNLILANNKASLLTGYSKEELLELNLKDLFPKDITINRPMSYNPVESDNTIRSEMEIIRKDGNHIPVEITYTKLPDGTYQSFMREISEQSSARNDITSYNKIYWDLIDKLPDGVYKRSSVGKFWEINSAMVDMLGYTNREEFLSSDNLSFLDLQNEYPSGISSETGTTNIKELQLKKKNGAVIWVEVHEQDVRDEYGNVLYREGIVRNITERKSAEIQLQKFTDELRIANSAKDKFFSIISHDLKNLFHSINSALNLILSEKESLSDEEKDLFLDSALSTSEKAYSLLEDLLNWSRSQMNTIEFNPEIIDISEIVLQNVELLRNNALLKKISIVSRIHKNTSVFADRNMFETLIRNLIANAIKFTRDGGLIEIDSRIVRNFLEVSIMDNGIGIEPKNINKLFRIDESFSTRGTKNETGTGLGLILCKEFVEKNNGKIWIESEVGKWTKVKFTLPLYE